MKKVHKIIVKFPKESYPYSDLYANEISDILKSYKSNATIERNGLESLESVCFKILILAKSIECEAVANEIKFRTGFAAEVTEC